MAIIVEEEKEKNPTLTLIITLIAIVFLVAGAYFLFLKPVPGKERASIPFELQSISNISKIDLDFKTIMESPVYQSLIKQVGDPDLGVFGRPNPFAPF